MDIVRDSRLRWILERTNNSLSVASQKWKKFVADNKTITTIKKFLDKESEMNLFFVYPKVNNSIMLVVSLTEPSTERKGIAFIKKEAVKIELENINKVITYEEISPNSLNHMDQLFNKVFLPLLSNPSNQRGWPRVISEDVINQFRIFSSSFSLLKGRIEGNTVLPIPDNKTIQLAETGNVSGSSSSSGISVNRNAFHSLESTLGEWTKKIKKVVSLNPQKIVDHRESNQEFLGCKFELNFWNSKEKDLSNMIKQLQDEKVLHIIKLLRDNDSTYLEGYDTIYPQLEKSHEEVKKIAMNLNEICKPVFLSILDPPDPAFHKYADCVFENLLKKIVEFWESVKETYNDIRVISLFRQVCNDLIEKMSKFIDVRNIYLVDPYDARKKLEMGLKQCNLFKATFFKTVKEVKEKEKTRWKFNREIIFGRFNLFIDRLGDILDIIQNVEDLNNLEKIQLGGIQGSSFQKLIQTDILTPFHSVRDSIIQTSNQSLMDLNNNSVFEKTYYSFVSSVADFDKKLCFIIRKSISMSSIHGSFKILEIFESQKRRDIIKQEIYTQYLKLMLKFDKDLLLIFNRFSKNKDNPPSIHDLPPISNAIIWCKSLLNRIEYPFSKFKQLKDQILIESNEMKMICKKYTFLVKNMKSFIDSTHSQWSKSIESIAHKKLQEKILKRDEEENLIRCNFDSELSSCIQEVKYLGTLKKKIPQSAIDIYQRHESFRLYINKLERVVNKYNIILKTMIPVEHSLLKDQISNLDLKIKRAFVDISWNDFEEIENFLQNEGMLISLLYDKLNYLKTNVKTIEKMIESWMHLSSVITMLDREKGEEKEESFPKFITLITFWRNKTNKGEDKQSLTNKVFAQWNEKTNMLIEHPNDLIDQGIQIHKIVQSSLSKISENSGTDQHTIEKSQPWMNYLEYLDDLIEKGLVRAVQHCLKTLINQFQSDDLEEEKEEIDAKKKKEMLLKVKLEFMDNDMTFKPSFKTIRTTVGHWLDRIFEITSRISKLNKSKQDDSTTLDEVTFSSVSTQRECLEMRQVIVNLLEDTLSKMTEIRKEVLKYSYLWEESPQESIETLYAEQMVGDIEDAIDHIPGSIGDDDDMVEQEQQQQIFDNDNDEYLKRRSNTDFEDGEFGGKRSVNVPTHAISEQIKEFVSLHEKIKKLNSIHDLNWLKVSTQSAKNTLSTLSLKWKLQYLEHLRESVVESMNEFYQFVRSKQKELRESTVSKGDYPALKKMMQNLLMISDREEFKYSSTHAKSIEEHFEPIREIISLLKKYEIDVDKRTLSKLDDAPGKWNALMKMYYHVKEKISVFQNAHIKKITSREIEFDGNIEIFYATFMNEAPFNFEQNVNVIEAYQRIDKMHSLIKQKEMELKSLRKKQKLFGLILNNGAKIKQAKNSLKLLKRIWDVASMVMWQIEEWKNLSFLNIKINEIVEQTKMFTRELRKIDVKRKRWDCYLGLEKNLKNFSQTLPLISNLRNPGMRPRHWKLLMKHTKVVFDLSDDFKLSDLLVLNLHKYHDEVEDIVNRCTKELVLEKQFTEFEKNWEEHKFEFKERGDNKIVLISVPETVIETLEDDQMNLQNISSQRFIEFFAESIDEWQIKLGNCDTIISLILEVQKKYLYLENIFLASQDIRDQLPEDARRFDSIDTTFKELIDEARKNPIILFFCEKQQNLEDQLKLLQEKLDMCEKKLSAYLEEKKKIFPRFYFVSVLDLLNIFSKGGRNPYLISSHFNKLFSSIKEIVFKQDEDGNKSNIATGMISIEGEHVDFLEPVTLAGKVEEWLIVLRDHIKHTIKGILKKSIQDYSEMNRNDWIVKYPTQIILATSQIYWNNEVLQAFEKLEENSEFAMKDYHEKLKIDLKKIIEKIQQVELDAETRRKIMNLITIDVHSKDIVGNLIHEKVETSNSFAWQSQLRVRWDENNEDCFVDICDSSLEYGYEYLGNRQRLVITPLTDRIYITLTQALALKMGGAPAGPAGTGKTETVKDLGNQVAIPVYIFNCSDAMDNNTLSDIFKGLSSSGSWGCFDEFNRIAVDVLSVVSTQFKTILDALRQNKNHFLFEGDKISLSKKVGVFITMNPGYKGRTELPENIKALFRPVTVVKPDFELICENMLMAEGFQNARYLSKKFITLYHLSKDLLSKADHYDWGLRAVKQVLNVAGNLRREEEGEGLSEEKILFRALRDFNLPKIIAEDEQIFRCLLGDIFPKCIKIERKVNKSFEDIITQVLKDDDKQPEPSLILKTVQLFEILKVRHSVFIIGKSGVGKTVIWKTLSKALSVQNKKRTIVRDINPKTVSTFELFGRFSEINQEWKDGLLSSTMRELASIEDNKRPKWIVLDGDLDTGWIESMNSVMDDNKLLTLANNDRIPLLDHMRLIFEISHLKFATPATVSRAGILHVSENEIGWQPYVVSWINRRSSVEQTHFGILFDRYVSICLEHILKNFKHVVPLSAFNLVYSLCQLLEGLLLENNKKNPDEEDNEESKDSVVFEFMFVFACVWAFGGALSIKDKNDYRKDFNRWWRSTWNFVKFPDDGTVFDYYINMKEKRFRKWENLMQPFQYDPEVAISQISVPTQETTSLRYFLDMFMDKAKPILLVGNAGCGKTNLIERKLLMLDKQQLDFKTINLNYYTDSTTLQGIMESCLVKKGGKRYVPEGSRNLVFFVDDLNMPKIDQYGTQSALTLLRQFFDHRHWYTREKWTIKEIQNIQFVAAMNPTSGGFNVNPRLQRHFTTFAVNFPSQTSLKKIYQSILTGHIIKTSNFSNSIKKLVPTIVDSTLEMNEFVKTSFPKTAVNFMYDFNLRDLSNIYDGLLKSESSVFKSPIKFIHLWAHECTRVYADRLVNFEDLKRFNDGIKNVIKSRFEEFSEKIQLEQCNIFTNMNDNNKYDHYRNYDQISKLLYNQLEEYNEVNTIMDLVLFKDAMNHVCRISRVISQPMGNVLSVGVGGSGKKSLAKLATFINGFILHQIVITKTYNLESFKEDLRVMYRKAGKGEGIVFLLTDTQIIDERFLVLINDLLSSGDILDLFQESEKDEICDSLKVEMKAQGYMDVSKPRIWRYFIEKVKTNLHTVLCFSPVGDLFRIRARNFPALVNCCVVDWFFPWPEEALLNVCDKMIKDIDLDDAQYHDSVRSFISYSQKCTEDLSENEYKSINTNFVTPKSFLEMNKLFCDMFTQRKRQIDEGIERLELGIERLVSTTTEVSKLEETLKKQQVLVTEKAKEADKLLIVVGKEKKIVEEENEKAMIEERKATKIQLKVTKNEKKAKEILDTAIPLVEAAREALKVLTPKDLTELKSFANPPKDVKEVMEAVIVLLTTKKGVLPKRRDWASGKKLFVVGAEKFKQKLENFDKDNIHDNIVNEVTNKYTSRPSFNPETIQSVSRAAGGICKWVINTILYNRVHRKVEPLRIKVKEAKGQLKVANEKLKRARAKVHKLQVKLREVEKNFEEKNNEKLEYQRKADETAKSLELSKRLIESLSSEKIRWGEGIVQLKAKRMVVLGDSLLASAFVNYCGFFDITHRKILMDRFKKFIEERKIPCSANFEPVDVLTNTSERAKWNNQGLPYDITSIEHACIFKHSKRFCLFVDPQLQGLRWVKNMYKNVNLVIIRHDDPKLIDKLERCVTKGSTVLMEGVPENIDASLLPVISRKFVKRGKYSYIQMNNEVEFNENFKIIFHTKLGTPLFLPEIQAELTLINFSVTPRGLDDQLLSVVVNKERSDLEEQRNELISQKNENIIQIQQLEDSLLEKLGTADSNILQNAGLIENLENNKRLSSQIIRKSQLAEETEMSINLVREKYRSVAERGSNMFFLLKELKDLEPMYKYSLNSFIIIFKRGMSKTKKEKIGDDEEEEVEVRVSKLIKTITYEVYSYVTKGLFERHRLTFATNLCLKVLEKDIPKKEMYFLLHGPKDFSVPNPTKVSSNTISSSNNNRRDVDPNDDSTCWIKNDSWQRIVWLNHNIHEFSGLSRDMEESSKRWKAWSLLKKPESGKFPKEWKNKTSFQKLLIVRALRPDRLVEATKNFIVEHLGEEYIQPVPYNIDKIYSESNTSTPIFFILFPGADPIKDIEVLGKKLGFSIDNRKFWNISLGRGQEESAVAALKDSRKRGGWVTLQNIHLMPKWLPKLEVILEEYSQDSHKDFRVFLSAEPSSRENFNIPQSILQNSIKITNEPTQSLQANILRAWDNFNQDILEENEKVNEFRTMLYTLCFFHGIVLGRKRFGYQGWSGNYSFSTGDLEISSNVLFSYLEQNEKIPWDDLRYIIGNIFYGGHITDPFDRRTCNTYLKVLLTDSIFNPSEFELAKDFRVPPAFELYDQYIKYTNDKLPSESPELFGLHANAEINQLTKEGETMFKSIVHLKKASISKNNTSIMSLNLIKEKIDEILDEAEEDFDLEELQTRISKKDPFSNVLFQECQRMNILRAEIRRSLIETKKGLNGELTISEQMDELIRCLQLDVVPETWKRLSYPSLRTLTDWKNDLRKRILKLEDWCNECALPKIVWLPGLFEPKSFLTAILQTTARKIGVALDRMVLQTEVLKKRKEEIKTKPKIGDGCYINGLFLQGASWNEKGGGVLAESQLKELTVSLPIVHVRAVPKDSLNLFNCYECPVYATRERGSTHVFTAQLRTKESKDKWILGGVALLLDDT